MQFAKKQRQNGFTIVELLIVIVVIAILAAITIVAYDGIQDRAYNTAVKSDLTSLAKKIKQYQIINGEYPTGESEMKTLDIKVTKSAYTRGMHTGGDQYWNIVYCWPYDEPHRFALAAQSKSGDVINWVNGSIGEVPGSQFSGGSGAICASAGNPIPDSNYRDWLYADGHWLDYVD